MLIVDEADALIKRNAKSKDNWQAFEWLRGMAEEGAVPVAFCGSLELCELEKVAPPLWRRMRRRDIIKAAPKADVELVAKAWAVTDPKAIEALWGLARKRKGAGNLGHVVNVCREARNMAGAGAITLQHVLAALEGLQFLQMAGE